MNNIFTITESEKERILGLHEESTKKQYLNVISEQSGESSITLPAGVYHKITAGTPESVITLPNGTIFSKTNDPNILITYQDKFYQAGGNKRMDGKISYNCATGKFKVSSINKEYNELDKNGVESKYLKPFCQKGSQQNTQTKTDTTQTKTDTTQTKTDTTQIKKQLTPQQQQARAEKCGYKNWDSYKKGRNNIPWYCEPKKNSQTFATQTTDLTKQIQTSLGVQNVTGSITDADLDLILTQLKQA